MMRSGASQAGLDETVQVLLIDSAAAAIAWRNRTGNRVVGYMGTDVPVELIEAAGLYPIRVGLPAGASLPASGRYFERGDSDIVAHMVESLLDGSLGFLDHLVIGNTPTFNVAVFHFLREARRRDAGLPSPPITLHELQHGGDAAAEAYNRDSCIRLAAMLEQLGSKITDDTLSAAIRRANAKRGAAAALAERRRADPPAISGTRALLALTRTQAIPDDPLSVANETPGHGPRVLFSGSDIGHLEHYPVIEEAGCVIVADDHDWGEQVFDLLVDEDGAGLAAIARRYTNRAPRAARWPMQDRIDAVVERAIAARAAGVVFWINDEDHASNWDLPGLVQALHGRGIATLNLGPQPADDYDAPAIVERTAEWLDTLSQLALAEVRS